MHYQRWANEINGWTNLWHNCFFEFRISLCQLQAFQKSKIAILGLIKGGQIKLKSGQAWAHVGQTFCIIYFLNFEIGGGLVKGGQEKIKSGQNFGIIGFLNFKFRGANFMLFKKAKLLFRLNKRWAKNI